jgi:N4-gp56 family major capsid protein
MAQGTTGTSALSAEVKALYDADFYLQGQSMVYHDQMFDLKEQMNGQRGATYNFPIVESQQPNASTLDELSDVAASKMAANEIVITIQEYGGAIEVTKLLTATSYADVYKQAAFANGYNLAESFDYISRAVLGQGSRSFLQNGRTARSGFAGKTTPADRLTAPFIELLALMARSIKMPLYEDNCVATIMHPFPYYDLLQDTGVRNLSSYSHPEMLLNGEVAFWSSLRIIVSANAKAFWGAGAAGAAAVQTTLSAAANPGDTTITIASGTGTANGQWLAIQDGNETGNTWFDTNELVRVLSGGGTTTLTIFALDPGPGDGGGLRYAHAIGKAVIDNNSVYPIPILGPNSGTKVCSSFTGPYGETVVTGPFDRLGRFLTFGWYALVGFARTRNAWLLRGEVGSSQS